MTDQKILSIAEKAPIIKIGTAYALWAAALDGGRVTPAQKNSINQVLSERKFDQNAKVWLQKKMDLCKQNSPGHLAPVSNCEGDSQHKVIQGVNYERDLLKKAVDATCAGAALDVPAAEILWARAEEGNKVSEAEFRTVDFIMAFYPTTQAAHDFLAAKLKAHSPLKSSKFQGMHCIVAGTKAKVAEVAAPEAVDDPMDTDSDTEDDDDDDCNFNFDTLAQQAVSAVQEGSSASSPGSRELRELGLDVGLGAEQLYLTSSASTRVNFDTAAPPGISTLEASDYRSGAGLSAPVVRTGSKEVRSAPIRPTNDSKLRTKEGRMGRDEKLAKWFNMPKRKLTPEMVKELQVLKLRSSYDPKRFYKANDSKALPTHFVRATEVGGGRVSVGLHAAPDVKWNNGRSFLNEVLRDAKSQEFTWKKHGEVNERGRAAFNSGHGKAGKNGSRKSLSGTKRGGAWKKNKKA